MKKVPNKRVCAYLIDLSAAFVLSMIGVYERFLGGGSLIFSTIFILIGHAYILVKDTLFDGQSIGKRIVGLKVLDMNDKPCNVWRSCSRNLIVVFADYIPFLLIIEYIVMRISREERRIGDHLAKTRVIDLRPDQPDAKFFWYSLLLVVVLTIAVVAALSPLSELLPEN